ncbi:hypothetical protein HN51_007727 [Arachis hypogaea]|nr:COP1-interactive protein 1 [Arachis duranensis]XP_015964532.1 COP1-interactive protein 1 [Arachis duranensis]XP_025699931.1 COP1-interactive protein 1 [Arachis hypogaea]XP_025699932.1 COP1-interactive protein 1 [Arachis hypogaea]QHO41922.1 uncharacterized protein DS421_5g149970 [Arachis hypogaea]QHO41923.1 uncharacterized protein DS421_5g149970 [Arachis hypogaea]QHO41924.1 uncharacterized protein DS421_5g149970 [Arachis hypogaea]RYR58823.1 hypothetical protein Ahy_A05g024693 isoform C [Ar
MVKHRLRDSMKSLFKSYIDPEKEAQLKGAKGEIQEKVKRILKLVKDEHLEEDDAPLELSKKESLVKLIEDFHSQYQSLYAKYDNLTDELRKKIIGKKGKESFSSSSDSDSDYSSMDKDSKNGQLENEFQKTINGMKQELRTAQMEVAELNQKLTVTSEEKQDLMKKLESTENESSSKIADLSSQINNLLAEMGKLHAQKTETEEEMNKATAQMMVLTTQVNNLQRDLLLLQKEKEERENAYEKLNEEYVQVDNWYKECKAKLEAAEKKIQVMTEEFHEGIGSKDQMIADLEQTTEDLKRDLEEKGDEINTLHENISILEVKLRMSNQKLRVADQLLSEKEEGFRKAEEKFHNDQRSLEERIAKLSATIAIQEDAYQEIVFGIKESVNSVMTGTKNIMWKFEDECKNYENYISNMSHELHIARNFVREMNKEKVQLKEKINHLEEQLQDKKKQELDLRQMVKKLDEKAREEELAKKNLRTNVFQLENTIGELQKLVKEKDQGILKLAEEKREAIRQLCLGIDYHRSRYNTLMDVVSRTRRG